MAMANDRAALTKWLTKAVGLLLTVAERSEYDGLARYITLLQDIHARFPEEEVWMNCLLSWAFLIGMQKREPCTDRCSTPEKFTRQ
jgi:hypothetical protein